MPAAHAEAPQNPTRAHACSDTLLEKGPPGPSTWRTGVVFLRQVMRKLRDFRLNRNNLLSGTLSDEIIGVRCSIFML